MRLQFETCDDGVPDLRTVTLPLTDASGAWEFDERDYEQPGGLGCPCPGTPFTITQQIVPAGYIAVAVRTPADSAPVRGDTIVLTPPGSGTYDGNLFFDRRPYILRGRVINDDTGAGVAGVEVSFDTLRGAFATMTDAAGAWEFDEAQELSVADYLPDDSADFTVELTVPDGFWAADPIVHAAGTVNSRTQLGFPDVPPDTYAGNEFHIAGEKDLEVTNTEHFSIEWCSDDTDRHYPAGPNSGGFDYIRIVSDTLELAWDTYSAMGYRMPPSTPGRSDGLILAHVTVTIQTGNSGERKCVPA
ncbi:MAG TPA: hypothetical protein EYH32_06985 [Anaerolineae bacterium]|nr:hypothetical protein [Anaerolineae bacterium]